MLKNIVDPVKIVAIISTILLVISLLGMVLFSRFVAEPSSFRLLEPMRLLILAPHQDDCVIQSGGLAIQNEELGGTTNIVYLTVTSIVEKQKIRQQEAQRAWQIPGDGINLIDLGYTPRSWDQKSIHNATKSISKAIEKFNPEMIVIPLAEGGHPDHDILNKLFWNVEHHNDYIVLQAALYNPYHLAVRNPSKVLHFLYTILPFVPYESYPTSGLDPDNQLRLEMTKEELEMKVSMLKAFESQQHILNISQFGNPDLFDSTFEVPASFVTIFNKNLDVWTFVTLILIFISLFSWGWIASRYLKFTLKSPIILFAFLFIFISLSLWFDRRLIMEHFLYIIPVLAGLCIGVVVNLGLLKAGK